MYLGIYASSPGYFGQYQITYMQLHDYLLGAYFV